MILSDKQILKALEAGEIGITPFFPAQLGTNSYDVRLGAMLARYTDLILDVARPCPVEYFEISPEGLVLYPHQFYLGVTEEIVGSNKYVAYLDGKSSIGRLGLFVHVTAGRGDVGFCDHWTMEMCVIQPVRVYAGMLIGQMTFHESGDVTVPYNQRIGSNYHRELLDGKQPRPVPSRSWKSFER